LSRARRLRRFSGLKTSLRIAIFGSIVGVRLKRMDSHHIEFASNY
jgi:hypothetical protein